MLVSKNGQDPISQILQVVDNEVEHHFHNVERWFGDGAVHASLTGYTVISGNGAFGAEVLLFDVAQTPHTAGMRFFDLHRLAPLALSSATVYLLRFIWGTGTVADAEAAEQYSTLPMISTGVGALVKGSAMDMMMPRLAVGTKVWAKCKNATNLATLTLLVGKHEYPD